MSLRVLGAKAAASLDKELMSTQGFSLDQLMELAGLSVAQAVYKTYPPKSYKKVLILSGPGNNGGDGLVAARHLKLMGYHPSVFYFIKSAKFEKLEIQLHSFGIPLYLSTDSQDVVGDIKRLVMSHDSIIDALFGFSFRPPLRDPYNQVIKGLIASGKPVISVDMPTGWDVDEGPRAAAIPQDEVLEPSVLVSLTAPKPASVYFKGKYHYLGGRFISEAIAQKYNFDVPQYPDLDQVVRL
ncbi:NADHX epimerase [Saccharomycopsis crataegensis]|uniref:NAD(P)H-hydrate epimerase n=1 Tax=Saccharomycopsis crataegensis TaxID=43959 RepID=A0AAV5QVX7_9ASCO|nr:NADHX epimerase [Saccharomycopsis crataegensis]